MWSTFYNTILIPFWKYLSIAIGFLGDTVYLWLPIVSGMLFFKLWMSYIRHDTIFHQKYFFIEVRLPREITKTPLAMEVFLTALWQKAPSTYIDTYWSGKVQPWFSLELVSIGGKVRFFIWGMEKYRSIVEAQLYAQYPEIEIIPGIDYAAGVTHDLSKTMLWGTYFQLSQKDVYPIKTYTDYGLDKEGVEEEYKVDPMTAVIEYLGSIRPQDQVWIQILIQAHHKKKLPHGSIVPTKDWIEEAKKEIEKLKKDAAFGPSGFPMLTKGQDEKMKAIERSVGKYAFDTIIRAFYISPANDVDGSAIPGLIGSVKQYNSSNLNGFKLGWYTDFDYPWQDFMRIRRTSGEKNMLRAYKLRSGFQLPYQFFKTKPFILTTEELATMYHFPGSVSRTPGLQRIESRRADAPTNLPR